MADIFLSYAREDRPWASRLAAGLIEHGWSLFWDAHIPVGKTFDQVIESQLDAARCIVVLWSRHSISSNWVKAEASEGARRGILHPVLIENVRLPLEFRRLQTANLIDWQGGTSHAEFDQLIGGIAATLRSPTGLFQEARAALGRGDYARCLEILREIADAAEAAGLGDKVAELRRLTEIPQAQAAKATMILHAAPRARNHWEDGESKIGEAETALAGNNGARMAAEREVTQVAVATPREGALWSASQTAAGAAEAAYEREQYEGAPGSFETAADLFQPSAPAAGVVALATEPPSPSAGAATRKGIGSAKSSRT